MRFGYVVGIGQSCRVFRFVRNWRAQAVRVLSGDQLFEWRVKSISSTLAFMSTPSYCFRFPFYSVQPIYGLGAEPTEISASDNKSRSAEERLAPDVTCLFVTKKRSLRSYREQCQGEAEGSDCCPIFRS